jgi:hypothetical protein
VKPSVEQIGALLALKRHERPEEGYMQDFLTEFHQRQRQEAVNRGGLSRMFGRLNEWFGELGGVKWAYGAGLAYAAVMAAFFLVPRNAESEKFAPVPVKHEVVPARAPSVEQLEQLDLNPSTRGTSGEQAF